MKRALAVLILQLVGLVLFAVAICVTLSATWPYRWYGFALLAVDVCIIMAAEDFRRRRPGRRVGDAHPL